MRKPCVMSCARGEEPQTDSTIAPSRRRTVPMPAATSPRNSRTVETAEDGDEAVLRVRDLVRTGMARRLAARFHMFKNNFGNFFGGKNGCPHRAAGSLF